MGLKNRGGANGEKIAILDFIYRQYVISPHATFLLQRDGDRQTQLFLRNFFFLSIETSSTAAQNYCIRILS